VLSDPSNASSTIVSASSAMVRRPAPGISDSTGGFGDIFDMFFGNVRGAGHARRSGPERGSDLRYDVEITLEEAFHGTTREIVFDRLGACATCNGSGARPGTMVVPCQRCGGSGIVRSARQTPLGQMVTQTACAQCGGEGHVIAQPCETCSGRGAHKRRRV